MNHHKKKQQGIHFSKSEKTDFSRDGDTSKRLSVQDAHDLLLKGEIEPAERILTAVANFAPDPDVLDLLARLFVQKGNWRRARAIWEEVLRIEPEHSDARAALRRMSSPWLIQAVAVRCSKLAVLAITFVLCGLGLLHILEFWPNSQQPVGPVVITASVPPPKKIEPMGLSMKTDKTRITPLLYTGLHSNSALSVSDTNTYVDSQESFPKSLDATPRVLPTIPNISIFGSTVSTNSGELTILPDEGVFRYRCELSAAGQDLLRNVNKSLSEWPPVENLLIEGYTDNEPMPHGGPYPSNYALGFARAATIAAWFRQHTTISREALVATSCGAENPPFSNENYDSRLRNRTVVLRFRFAQE